MERLTTGVPGLDEMVEGGFKQNSSILVTGGVGVGKSTFSMQYLCEGAKNGEGGIYLTFEEDVDDLKTNLARYDLGIGDFVEKGLIRIIRLNPNDIMTMVKSGYGGITNFIKDSNATRVVIDSIGSIELMISDEYKKRENLLNLLSWLRRNNCTSILVSEAEQHPNNYSRTGIIEYLVDSVIVLYNIRRHSVRQRALEVLKMRGTDHMTKVVPFVFGRGVELMPKQKLFGDF